MIVERIGRHLSGLWITGNDPAGTKRFAGLFRSTLLRLPTAAYADILQYWFREPASSMHSLQIELLDSPAWRQWCIENVTLGSWAAVVRPGRHLIFHEPLILRFPDEVIEDCIGHELSHCLQWCHGVRHRTAADCEADAIRRAVAWGFRADSRNEWIRRQSYRTNTYLPREAYCYV